MTSAEKENSLSLTEMSMKETLLKENSKESEDMSSDKIKILILENGKLINIMDKESILMPKEKLLLVFGKKIN